MPAKKNKKKKIKKQAGASAAASSEQTEPGRVHLRDGNDAFRSGLYPAAIAHYTTGIEQVPPPSAPLAGALRTNRGASYTRTGDYWAAGRDCTEAIRLNPASPAAYRIRALCSLLLGDYPRAKTDYDAACRLLPDDVRVHKAREHALDLIQTRRKMTEADKEAVFPLDIVDESSLPPVDESEYVGAAAESSGSATANRTSRASTLEDLSEPPPLLIPIGEFTDVLVSDGAEPLRATKEKELGNKAFSDGDNGLALFHYSNAIKLNPSDPVFYSNRGHIFNKLERYYEAITDCTSSIDRRPSIKAFARRAVAWSHLRYYLLAAEDYKRALQFEPGNRECISDLQRCLLHMESECETALRENPQNERIHTLLRHIKDDQAKYLLPPPTPPAPTPAAAASPAAASAEEPPPPTFVKSLPKHDTDLLVQHWTDVLSRDRSNSFAFLNRAQLYLALGEIEKALADFKIGLRLDPDNRTLQQGFKTAREQQQQLQQQQRSQPAGTQQPWPV